MKSVRTKFVANTVFIFFAALVLMFTLFALLMHAFFRNTVNKLDQMESELVAEDVDMRLGEYRSITEGLAQNANLVDMLVNCKTPEAFNRDHNFPLIVESMNRVYRENTSLWVFNVAYEYQITGGEAGAKAIGLSAKDRENLEILDNIMADTLYTHYTMENGLAMYNVVSPVMQGGKLVGLVGTSIDMEVLLQQMQEKASLNNMSTNCAVLVPSLDESLAITGYTKVFLGEGGTLTTETFPADYPSTALQGRQKAADGEQSGEKYLSPIGDTGWYLTQFVSGNTINSVFMRDYLNFGLVIFLLFTVVILALVALMALRISRPIRNLDALVADIRGGRPYEKLKGNNEITRAADSLIELVNDNQQLLEEIKNLAEKIAIGELFTRFDSGRDEYTQHAIKASLNQMLDSIAYILNNLPLGVAVLDEDYRLIYMNEAIRSLLEVEPDVARQGLPLSRLQQVNEQSRQAVVRGIDACKAKGKNVSEKLFWKQRHLSLTTVQLEASYGGNTKQVFLQVFLNQTDVMEKIQEQEQIFAYFEHLSLVKKEALDRLSKGDFDHAILEIGQRPSAPYLQNIYDDQLDMKQAFRETVENIEEIIGHMQKATTAFAKGNLHAMINALNAKGQYGNLVKTANNAFHVILSYFQSIPVPIRIIGQDYRVVFSNQASAVFSPAEKNCCYHWFEEDEPCLSCPYNSKTQKLTIRELTLEQDGKRSYWRVYRNPLLDENGEIVSMLEILFDETEVVELKKAADSANMAKSTFLANMSHEIRTPMNAILGYSQLLEMSRDLRAEDRSHVETIKRSGGHLLGLINDILELSKIEAGKIQLNPEPFDLAALLQDVKSIFRPQMEAKNLLFTVQIPALPYNLLGDMGKIRQILINLVSNAMKFTQQGEIVLKLESEEKKEGRIYLRLDVIDNGSGIAVEERGKVFAAFEQTQSGLQAGGGTGLGMAISRNFARMMKGDLVLLESCLGRGTTFRLTLELEKSREGLKQALDTGIYGNIKGLREPKTVLVAEATEDNRALLQKILQKLGFKVLCAQDNQTALELWRQHAPQLLTTDLSDEGLEGLELIRRIRSEEGEGHTPILVLTANAMQQDKEDALCTGADLFLTKPLVVETLAHAIEKLTGAEYIFGEETEDAAPLPKDMPSDERLEEGARQEVLQAVLQGDFDAVLQIAQLAKGSCPHLAQRLTELADDFDKDAIIALLNQAAQ